MKRNTHCLCSNVHEPLLPKAQNQFFLNRQIVTENDMEFLGFKVTDREGFWTFQIEKI
jgi:hypothetical protein